MLRVAHRVTHRARKGSSGLQTAPVWPAGKAERGQRWRRRPNGLVLEIQEAGAERSAVSLECALESATGSRSGSELRSLARGTAYAAADGARTLRRLAERKRGGRSRRGRVEPARGGGAGAALRGR